MKIGLWEEEAQKFFFPFCAALSLQWCPTLCGSLDCSPPGPSVHGMLQARMLQWVLCPPPEDLPHPETEPVSLTALALAGGFFTTSATWEALLRLCRVTVGVF